MAIKVKGQVVIDDNQNIISSGEATFSNTVTGQQISNNALSAFEAVDANGTRFKVTGAGVLSLYDNTSTENITLSSTGSASFGGDMGIGTQFPTQKLDVRGNVYIGDDLDVDGSAIFDGSVESKNNFLVKAVANDQTCFRVTDSSGSTIRTSLKGDGSASFANTLKIQPISGAEIADGDAFRINWSDGTPKVVIDGYGSATFEAGVDVRTQDGQRGLTINSSSSSQNQALKINNNGGSQVTLLNHDGSASFAGAVDAAGFTVNGSPMSSGGGGLSFAYTYDSSFGGSSNSGPVAGKLVTSNTNLDSSTNTIYPNRVDADGCDLASFYQSLSGGYLKV